MLLPDRSTLVGSLFVFGLTSIFCWLGIWQLGRAQDKEESLRLFEERRHAPVAYMDQLPSGRRDNGNDMRGQRVRIDGHYPADLPYLYLDNQTRAGTAGYGIYRLFRLRRGGHVPVFLGWRPVGLSRNVLPVPPPVPADSLTVSAVLMTPPAAGLSLQPWRQEKISAADEEIWRLPSWSMEKLAQALQEDILPYIARPAGVGQSIIKPYGGLPPERHRGYAFQWFSLAVLCPLFFLGVKKWAG